MIAIPPLPFLSHNRHKTHADHGSQGRPDATCGSQSSRQPQAATRWCQPWAALLLLSACVCSAWQTVPLQAQDTAAQDTAAQDTAAQSGRPSPRPAAKQRPAPAESSAAAQGGDTSAQDATTPDNPTTSEAEAAQATQPRGPQPKVDNSKDGLRLMQAGARTGVSRYQPGVWGSLAITVSNRSDQPREVLVATYFEENPLLHYGRRVWIPPRSILETTYPIQPPAKPRNPKQLEFRTLMQADGTEPDSWSRAEDGARVYDGVLPLSDSRSVTGFVGDRHGDELRQNLASTARVNRDLRKSLVGFHDKFFPANSELLQGMDQVVICTDRLHSDPAGTAALRRWIQAGGYAWIMLDQVQPETVTSLLGDAFDTHIVDRVSLTSILLTGEQGKSRTPAESEPREFEEPIPLVRVVPGDVDLEYSINGWPAAYWYQVGNGRVLITTLGARAWIRDRRDSDTQGRDLNFETPFVALAPLATLATQFFENKPEYPLKNEDLKPFLAEQIGYAILSRQQILGILGGLSLFLLLAGWFLTRRHRGEHLGWLAPFGALATAGVLIWLGSENRQQVPPTLATAQLVQLVPGADDVNLRGMLAAFNSQESTQAIGSASNGMFFPDMSGLEGRTRRMVWTDLDDWNWEQLRLPPGVRNAPFQYYGPLKSTPSAVAKFTATGLQGRFASGGFQNVEDLVIALPKQRALWTEMQEDGSFLSGPDRVLAKNQYIGDALLSDKQRRRQQIYQKLLTYKRGTLFPSAPMLLAWADPLDLKFSFPDTTRSVGSALLSIPLTIQPTPPDTHIQIPSAFLVFRSTGGPNNQSASSAYSNLNGEWIKSRRASRSHFRFQLPAEVLPIQLDRAQLTMHIDASSREVSVNGVLGETVTPLKTISSPVGRITVDIDQAAGLELDEKGGLTVGIYVGDHEKKSEDIDEDESSFWQFNALQLEVSGVTLQD